MGVDTFEMIPGNPVAYWASMAICVAFTKGASVKAIGDTRQGMATSDNARFLRLWHEPSLAKTSFTCANSKSARASNSKWFAYNKGGEYRKWYGNQDYVLNYENDGYEIKSYAASLYKTASRTIKSESEYFKACISWSKISSANAAFRFYPKGFF